MITRFAHDLKKYLPYTLKAAKAKLEADVAGSYLNWIWWILNPLCFMMIYAFIFGTVFQAREPHFSVFIFSGLTIFNFFSHTVTSSVSMIRTRRALVSKIYLPKYILIITSMLVNGFKMLISVCVIVVMLIWYRIPLTWCIFYIFPCLISLFLITFSVSCFALHCGVYIRDLSNAVTLIMRMMLYLTGIFYDVGKRIPAPWGHWAVRLNPLACILTQIRGAMLDGQILMWPWLVFWLVFGLIFSLLGASLIYRNENNYVKVV